MDDSINKMHIFLRNLRNNINNSKKDNEVINTIELDDFCTILSEFILEALNKGFSQVDCDTIKFTGKYTKEYFITGFNLLQNGISNEAVIAALEFLTAFIFKTADDISANEMLEISILERALPMIQRFDIKDYLYMIESFSSGQNVYIHETFRKHTGT
jgi:hypothetical protein